MPSPIDSITLCKTDSLRWLAQIVFQIIKAVKWENQLKCDGSSSLADFRALVCELEELDPVTTAVLCSGRDGSVRPQLQPPNVVQVAEKLDRLLDLLDATADGLAVTCDQRRSGEDDFPAGDDVKATIH